jgi:hypothetical protein
MTSLREIMLYNMIVLYNTPQPHKVIRGSGHALAYWDVRITGFDAHSVPLPFWLANCT